MDTAIENVQAETPSDTPLPEWKQALTRAADMLGGWAALCRATAMNRNTFYRVMREYDAPTAEIAIAVSKATGGRVKIDEIMPEMVTAVLEEQARARRRSRTE